MMKMVVLVYREYLDEEIQTLVKTIGVSGFSEVPKLFGIGEAGKVMDSQTWPGHNVCIFAVLPEEQTARVVAAAKTFTEKHRAEHGKPAPMRGFVLPCEHVF